MTLELTTNYKDMLTQFYNEDSKYKETSPHGILSNEECIQKDIEDLTSMHKDKECYKVLNDNDLVGYFCHEPIGPGHLSAFFIRPKYRQNKTDFWNIITSTIKYPFYAAINEKNQRTINFYKKNGGIIIDNFKYDNEDALLFLFNGRI